MESGLVKVGALVVGIALTAGPVVVWAILLNLRDRRQARLLGAVLAQVASPELRGRVAIRVRSGVLSPSSVITLDMSACSHEEIWDTIVRLSQSFPPPVRLVVDGMTNRQLSVTLTVTPGKLLSRPPRPSAAHA